jgi:hypothetical protein
MVPELLCMELLATAGSLTPIGAAVKECPSTRVSGPRGVEHVLSRQLFDYVADTPPGEVLELVNLGELLAMGVAARYFSKLSTKLHEQCPFQLVPLKPRDERRRPDCSESRPIGMIESV